jgi:ABC-type proline/glycine betaine transport system permease subunit
MARRFDIWTSGDRHHVGYAIPGFLFAVLLIVLFRGRQLSGLVPACAWPCVSDNWSELSWPERIADYFWHLTLPIIAMALGAFATTTLLTKNSFLDEVRKQYVMTARMKGLTERKVLYGHVFRNAMLIIIAGFPGAFVSAFFTGALLIETIFSLDGLGLLSFESIVNRDYPVVFATLYIFSLMGLIVNLISDSDLHLGRSADRFRKPGRVMDATPDTAARRRHPCERTAGTRRRGARPVPTLAAQPAALAEFQEERARLLVAVAVRHSVRCWRCLQSSSPTTSQS